VLSARNVSGTILQLHCGNDRCTDIVHCACRVGNEETRDDSGLVNTTGQETQVFQRHVLLLGFYYRYLRLQIALYFVV
jgi:hypothetical protein